MKRSGFTLVEFVVSLAIASSMMLLAIGVVQRCMESSQRSQNSLRSLTAISQFIHQFREDVHLAARVDVTDEQTIRIDSSAIVYSIVDNRIRRTVSASDAGPQQRNEYDLGNNGFADFTMREDRPECIRLRIGRAPLSPASEPRIDRHIEVQVGTWRWQVVAQTEPVQAEIDENDNSLGGPDRE